MSIVALKNKTAARYNNMSVGATQFSLNGGHRSQGWVGQTMLSRSLPRTPMKGNVPKGHGGCCGKYDDKHIIQSAVTSLNDSNVIKSSSLNTMGMINTHYRWIRRPPLTEKTFIDPKSNNVDTVKKKILACGEDIVKDIRAGAVKGNCGSIPNYQKPMICSVVTKKALRTTTQSSYIDLLRSKCNIEIKNKKAGCGSSIIANTCGSRVIPTLKSIIKFSYNNPRNSMNLYYNFVNYDKGYYQNIVNNTFDLKLASLPNSIDLIGLPPNYNSSNFKYIERIDNGGIVYNYKEISTVNEISVGMWAKVSYSTSSESMNYDFNIKEKNGILKFSIQIYFNRLFVYINSHDGSTYTYNITDQINFTNWTHIFVTVENNGTLKIYKNSILIYTSNTEFRSPFLFNNKNWTTDNNSNTKMGPISVYSTCLTSTEVNEEYNNYLTVI